MTLHEMRHELASKYVGDKRLSIEQYNIYLREALFDVLKEQIGFPNNIAGAETDQYKRDALRKYKKTASIALTTGTGTLPSDYMRLLPDSCSTGNIIVTYVTEAQWKYRIGHSILAPDTDYPICKITGNSIYVSPTTITTIDIVYYKTPLTPVYAVTMTNGIQTYNTGSSVELEIDEEYHQDIVRKILEYLSVPETNENRLGYLQQKKIEEA